MDNIKEGTLFILRKELFAVWSSQKSLKAKNFAVSSHVLNAFNVHVEADDENLYHLKQQIGCFNTSISQKWKESNRTTKRFLSQNVEWLNQNVEFNIKPKPLEPHLGPSSSQVQKKEFKDLTHVSKKRRVKPLLEMHSQDELTFAAQTCLRSSGHRDAAKLIGEITENSPTRATKIKQAWKAPKIDPVKYTPEEALALYIDAHLTKHSYKLIQSGAKGRHANIYPTYDVIVKAKKACYPEEEFINISETSAEVKVQALANHTAYRLLYAQEEVLTTNYERLGNKLSLIYKWGCDGSSGHSLYKQKFSGDEADSETDAFLFAVCIVPLQLKSISDNTIVWHNPKPSSTRYCRPIKILFKKETKELTKLEIENVEEQISNILPSSFNINGYEFVVEHIFKLTMINGKTFNVITNSSSQSCGICGATPKEMNNIHKLNEFHNTKSAYEYGISSLHAWIRCLECMLHIAYRLNIKKWQIRGEEDKDKFEKSKKKIQRDLKLKMGLLVDITKPGYGTTNDGNTASRFFENYKLAATVTGLDENLLKRLKVILQTISCGYAVNVGQFKKYAMETAEIYVSKYPWFYMPASVHKLLIHGADIIEAAILPIGMFSEEALEARNKDMRRYREFHTRKFSRLQNMADLFHTLLFSSDPIISSISKRNNIARPYNISSLEEDVLLLLSEPTIEKEPDLSDDSDSDASEK